MSKFKQKIIFLDIDGPMIPARAFVLEGSVAGPGDALAGFYTRFDPVAVAMINHVIDRGWRLVLHTSWIRFIGGEKAKEHCIREGINPNGFHDTAWCDEDEVWRYTRISKFLREHPEVTDYFILDDTAYEPDNRPDVEPHPEDMEDHLLHVDFNEGMLLKHFYRILHYDSSNDRST